jgi:hypothetical protein
LPTIGGISPSSPQPPTWRVHTYDKVPESKSERAHFEKAIARAKYHHDLRSKQFNPKRVHFGGESWARLQNESVFPSWDSMAQSIIYKNNMLAKSACKKGTGCPPLPFAAGDTDFVWVSERSAECATANDVRAGASTDEEREVLTSHAAVSFETKPHELNRTYCFVGASHSRHIAGCTSSLLGAKGRVFHIGQRHPVAKSVHATSRVWKWSPAIDTVLDSSAGVVRRRFDANGNAEGVSPRTEDDRIHIAPAPDKARWVAAAEQLGCTHTVIALGQWPLSGKRPQTANGAPGKTYPENENVKDHGPYGPTEFGEDMEIVAQEARAYLDNPSVVGAKMVALRSINYNGLGYPGLQCPPEEGRTMPHLVDQYNTELRRIAIRYKLPFLDTSDLMRPIWDTAFDHCHYEGAGHLAQALELLKMMC